MSAKDTTSHCTRIVMRITTLLCVFVLLFLTGCSSSENAATDDSFDPLVVFETSHNAHPLVLNAWVRNNTTTGGFIEFDMAYRLERFVDGNWQCLDYIVPPNFSNRTVLLYAGEQSNAYV